MRSAFLIVILIVAHFGKTQTQSVGKVKISTKPIPCAHAHNDYNKIKPLWGALKYGFTSVEVDVFAHKGQLRVAHVGVMLGARKTLESMYLAPLKSWLQNKNWVYENYQEALILMIDFKTNRHETLPILLEIIKPYQHLLTYYHDGKVHKRPLQLLISGHGFGYEQVSHLDSIFVFLDGSVNHCESDFPAALVPRGSGKFSSHFFAKLDSNDVVKMQKQIEKAETCDKKLRYYATKNKKKLWRKQLDAQVGWLNVDRKKKFAKFYWEEYQAQ
jgi:hypothetical protein